MGPVAPGEEHDSLERNVSMVGTNCGRGGCRITDTFLEHLDMIREEAILTVCHSICGSSELLLLLIEREKSDR